MNGELYTGDCVTVLKGLDEGLVHTCITSPPYWSLRDYGNSRKDQIGTEGSPLDYIHNLSKVFRAIKKVLRENGTLWVIIGDAYARYRIREMNVKSGDLIGLPWLFATTMRNDGWYMRYEGIWHKRGITPSNTKSRPILAHEHIFMFTKKQYGYYYDQYAILSERKSFPRSVWEIPVDKTRVDHSATFPIDLPLKIIKASTSQMGCCAKCGEPFKRVLSRKRPREYEPAPERSYKKEVRKLKRIGIGIQKTTIPRPIPGQMENYRTTTSWRSGCKCKAKKTQCIVLDPFLGSGTTAMAAEMLGRKWIGIELFKKNVTLSRRRINSVSVGTELLQTKNKRRRFGLSNRT